MKPVFSNPPRKGQPAKIWNLEFVQELAAELEIFEQNLKELNALNVVAWYGDGYHYGRLTVKEVAIHSQRIIDATFDKPIILSCEGWVMDGYHRIAKAHLEGMETISAVQFDIDPEPTRISTWHDWHESTLRE